MMTLTEDVALLPPDARLSLIPKAATWLLLGATVHEHYKGGDGFALELDGFFLPLATEDMALASGVKVAITTGHVDRMLGGRQIIDIYRAAEDLTRNSVANETQSDKRLVMLKDKGGAGYWRMVLPARYLDRTLSLTSKGSIRIDVTGADVKFDYLLEYDTIYVQRLMDWESYYILMKLKKAGKRIVYDIDDDIYSLSPDNPAFHVITRDNQQAAAACMKLADVVTTTTDVLANRLMQVVDEITPEVIPNALDTDDNWLPTEQTGSPDGHKRIYWQGSATHEQDWEVCIEAVDLIMKNHDDVRLVLLGYLPKCIIQRLSEPHWKGRVEHIGFSKPETYFDMIHHVRADVAVAPLHPQPFNESKCLDFSTLVPTKVGLMPIGDIREGDSVWRNGWKRVECVNMEPKTKGFEIETEYGNRILLSLNHRLLVNGEWKEASRMKVGDRLLMSRSETQQGEYQMTPWPSQSRASRKGVAHDGWWVEADSGPRILIDERWGRLLGVFAGDGCCYKTSVSIHCDGIDEDWIDALVEDFRNVGMDALTENHTMYDGTKMRRRSVRVANSNLQRFLEHVGVVANGKRVVCVPKVIFRSPRSVIREFISAYFEADGTCGNSGVSATSKDEGMLRDIQQLLLLFGITSRLTSRVGHCQTGGGGIYWKLSLRRKESDLFASNIGFKSTRKGEALRRLVSGKHSNACLKTGWEPKIVAIREASVDPVDIQVEGEAFIAAGIVSHNSSIKWLEATLIGVPVVASAMEPYASVIEDGDDGRLVTTTDSWFRAIEEMLLCPVEKRREMVGKARSKARYAFDIKKVAVAWKEILFSA